MKKRRDKALSPVALEFTQKLQMHFPRDIKQEILTLWNGCHTDKITERLRQAFGSSPDEIFGVKPKPKADCPFPVWKTIKVVGKSANQYRAELSKRKLVPNPFMLDMLWPTNFHVLESETELDLVLVSYADIGLADIVNDEILWATLNEVMGDEYGLEVCPDEVGPALLLQEVDLPVDKDLLIMMHPMNTGGEDVFILHPEKEGSQRIVLDRVCEGDGWNNNDENALWVAVKPRTQPIA